MRRVLSGLESAVRAVDSVATSLERVEGHLENPVAVLNMVWRLARIWPRKIKALLAHQVLAFKDFRYINHIHHIHC